ncbi:MAG: hypothetical protein GX316_04025 [Firmicutes bacterium]|nr:hypothetical protein [Bacillota bacterium]
MIITVGNWEIDITVQEQKKSKMAERVYRETVHRKQLEREREKAYVRLFLSQGSHPH